MSLAIISTRLDVLNFIRKDFLNSPYNFTGELDFGTTINVLISVNDLPGVMGIYKVIVDKVHDIRYNNESVSIVADVTVPNSDMYTNYANHFGSTLHPGTQKPLYSKCN